tara:strand:- start:953 stop:1318 length:366 start_codon:yes stop_codon:yes gene_type:complete
MLNTNDLQSVLAGIKRTEEEIGLAKRDVWPNVSVVPENARQNYLATLEAQLVYLANRTEILALGPWATYHAMCALPKSEREAACIKGIATVTRALEAATYPQSCHFESELGTLRQCMRICF